jgi:SAM-dependent methyltransferase
VTSRSARVSAERPFHDLHADAYDALVTDSPESGVEAVHARLAAAGCHRARVLDAGCGTGRHARGLLDRGYHVELLDASPRLLGLAARRCPGSPAHEADLCGLGLAPGFDAVTCRGVLNDLVTDAERDAALASFARVLRPVGLLFLDVREAGASRVRADGTQRRRTVTLGEGATLSFVSRPRWREGQLLVAETYELSTPDGRVSVHDYDFEIRPRTADEVRERATVAGFDVRETLPGVGRSTPDRLFVVAARSQ